MCMCIFAFENKTKRQTFSLEFFITFFFRCRRYVSHSHTGTENTRKKITLNDNVQTIIVVWSVLYVESVWGAVATEIL